MNFVWLVLLSISLCFDTLAISLSIGINEKKVDLRQMLKIAFIFGLFQGLMPLIGWFCGDTMEKYISFIDHWIAFGLLLFIGCKMIIDTFKNNKEQNINVNSLKVIIVLAIATSIDALAVGITLGITGINIWQTIICISLFTFITSIIGIFVGEKTANTCNFRIDIIGGFILIGLGIKILIEHSDHILK